LRNSPLQEALPHCIGTTGAEPFAEIAASFRTGVSDKSYLCLAAKTPNLAGALVDLPDFLFTQLKGRLIKIDCPVILGDRNRIHSLGNRNNSLAFLNRRMVRTRGDEFIERDGFTLPFPGRQRLFDRRSKTDRINTEGFLRGLTG
jgi:hypothetical protein